MEEQTFLSVIVLAAGTSSRLGRPKQLLPWGDRTLLDHAISQAGSVSPDEMIVVLGSNHEEITSKLDLERVSIILNNDYKEGMGSSIAKAADHISDHLRQTDLILIMLCDQPLISGAYLKHLLDVAAQHGGIAATNYDGKPGVPAVFDRKFLDHLTNLSGDRGARKLMTAHSDDLILCQSPDPLTDIDTEQDYIRACYSSKD